MTNINMEIKKKLHKKLKEKAAKESKTLKQLVTEILERNSQ